MALIDDFKARFPEFDETQVDTYLPILEPVWPAYYAVEYDPTNARNKEAILNLIAHLFVYEVRTSAAASKEVASKTVGSVSTSYVQSAHSSGQLYDTFSTTKYGQRFLLLIRSNYGGVAV